MIVVRDSGFEEELEFGLDAGKNYIKELLTDSPYGASQHRLIKSYLQSNFGEIESSLLPRPNKVVSKKLCSVSG